MNTAIYLRQSLDRDLDKVSIDYQREGLRKLCAAKDWADPTEYMDRNVSATTGRRDAYEDLCTDIAAGAIARVAVWDMDRLHRQPRELENFIDLVDKHHVELANVGGDVDLSTPSGRMFARVKGSVAKYEVEQKGARQKAANAERAKRGTAWVARTFGYDDDAIVWEEAEAIRDACKQLLNGVSLWAIAKQWNEAGILTVKAGSVVQNGKHKGATITGEWSGGTVRQVLMRPRNAGLAVYGGETPKSQDGKRIRPDPRTIVLDGVETSWPAIVSRDTWESVCAYLSDPKRMTGKSTARVHLLSGIAMCGLCGHRIGIGTRKTKRGDNRPVYAYKRMQCMRIVRDLARIDALVTDVVTQRLARPDAAKIFARPTVDARALGKRANELRALVTAAETDYDTGEITAARMNARIERLRPELDAIEATMLGANTSRKLDGLIGQPDAAQRFAALSLDRRRAVVDTVATVTIEPNDRPGGMFDPQKVRIDWR